MSKRREYEASAKIWWTLYKKKDTFLQAEAEQKNGVNEEH